MKSGNDFFAMYVMRYTRPNFSDSDWIRTRLRRGPFAFMSARKIDRPSLSRCVLDPSEYGERIALATLKGRRKKKSKKMYPLYTYLSATNVFILFRSKRTWTPYNIVVVYCEKVTSNFSLFLLAYTRFRVSLRVFFFFFIVLYFFLLFLFDFTAFRH